MSVRAQGSSVAASAPGRVNLIGEHTDYNDGFVLPAPIPQETRVHLLPRSDDRVFVTSTEQERGESFTLGSEQRAGGWLDYVQGVTAVLRRAGHEIGGFDAQLESNVPMGAGLSSSAALEVALLRALRSAFSLRLSDLEIAQLGQRVEVDFVGVPIGIMDQMASSLGRPGRALLIDTRSLETRDVAIPEQLELVVIASGVLHAHDTGDYRTRRSECERAAKALGIAALRDITIEQLEARERTLDDVCFRRARHVVTENARVLEMVDALASCDTASLQRLMAASHASMRDDYEVSVRPIDLLVSLAAQEAAIIGARLTGGGFGGSVVMLASRGEGRGAAQRICAHYQAETRHEPRILLPLE